ncbi:MAG: hypothetical protein JRJ43_01300 [Deltaproteobacteria bacterium]|nr:hypothetical protein [Deltaproteobacteria bacterium]MBW1718187.1 hypothetical protein [Deltaproteobacteria bacterium]MBW1931686.1 hypothetical protein [Deltaproteobacteria bacterium]MBW1937163.1 hypothetical protein [Deltaproteobacteria bacterium]MBW1965229.1 hypothetical protein [Deltaproteobacteria bacterium]
MAFHGADMDGTEKAKSEKETINVVLKKFDTDFQLAEVTLKDADFCFKNSARICCAILIHFPRSII